MIKLDSNESPFGPSPKATAAMQAAVERGNRYPDNDASVLRTRLAALHRLEADQVLITAGLTDFLGILCRALLKPGLIAITSQRSFIVYSLATKGAGARLVEVPMQNDAFDLPMVAKAITPETKIVFLANPNNPTGTAFDSTVLDKFLSNVPDSVIVVVDEAYYDYAAHFAKLRHFNYSHSTDYVRERRNVLVLRTFSKAHGLAGLRVAYAIGQPELLKSLARARSTFSVSEAAQCGALAAMDDEDHLVRALENNHDGVDQMTAGLMKMGCRIPQPWGNFVYCELGEDARAFAKQIEKEGVQVRPLGPWGAPTAIRVTIGTAQENERFLAAFQKVRTAPIANS